MPRKRAKLAARQSQREAMGYNLAPSTKTSQSDMPARARALFAGPPPKRDAERSGKDDALKIRPTERISEFNQRVEQAFSSDIHATMRREQRSESNTRKRARRHDVLKAKKRAANPALAHADAAADWARAATARPLHDVAQAPPTLTARPKQRKKAVVEPERPTPSLARQRILSEEREKAVAAYRAKKREL